MPELSLAKNGLKCTNSLQHVPTCRGDNPIWSVPAISPKYPSVPPKAPEESDSWNSEDSTPVVSPFIPIFFMGHSPTDWAHLQVACEWVSEWEIISRPVIGRHGSLSKARQGSHWSTQFSREVEVYTSLFVYNITPLIRLTGGCCT